MLPKSTTQDESPQSFLSLRPVRDFFPQYKIRQQGLANVQANWSADIQLVPCPVSDTSNTLCQRDLSEGKNERISLGIMNRVGRDVGKSS